VRGTFGCPFTKIDERRAAVGHADQHESAAADISCERMRDSERESHGNRGIDRIATAFQNGNAGVSRDRLLRDHHGSAGVDRLARAEFNSQDEEDHRGKTSHTLDCTCD
jgi:hypothetical protein